MSDVQYQEPQYGERRTDLSPEFSWPTRLVLKLGLARDAASAQKVLVIALALLILIGILLWHTVGAPVPPPVTNPGM